MTKPEKKSFLKALKEKSLKLPLVSGVYFMKSDNKILYIGKAKNIKNRVQSYFSSSSLKTSFLLKNTKDIDYIITSNEAEALLLEARLIKKHQPRYNIRLKDDKAYPYIKASLNHSFPRFELARKVQRKKGHMYYGPYSSSALVRDLIALISQVFYIRDCKDAFMKNRVRPCLTYQIGRCKAPCVDLVSKDKYHEDFQKAQALLKGQNKKILKELERKMNEASEEKKYEVAAHFRDQIRAIHSLWEKQSVVRIKDESKDIDVFGFYEDQRGFLVELLYVRGGGVSGHRCYFFSSTRNRIDDKEEFFVSFLTQYYTDNLIPQEIYLPLSLNTSIQKTLEEVLSSLKQSRVCISELPQHNELMKTCFENAKNHFDKKVSLYETQQKALLEIQRKLHLDKIPFRMECYDISHLQGNQTVASCIVFEDGDPKKQDYRKYKLKTKGGDDYASMREVFERRFSKESAGPDLILVDGGKGQLSVAIEVLRELEKSHLPIVAVAKQRTEKAFQKQEISQSEERFFLPNRKNPVLFKTSSLSFRILVQLRDEAHRFALSFHRNLRKKNYSMSVLDSVKGLGPKKRRVLLEKFGSIELLKKASKEELLKVPSLNQKIAHDIYELLKNI